MATHRDTISTTDLEQLLVPACRQLQWARFRVRLGIGAEHLLWWLVASTGVVAIDVALRAAGAHVSWPILAFAVAPVAAGALLAFVPALLALRRPISWLEVTERLDAAQDGHNRITTAWSLCSQGANSPFALAAIRQGEVRLREVCHKPPFSPKMTWHAWRDMAACAVIVGALAVVGLIPSSATPPGNLAKTSDARHARVRQKGSTERQEEQSTPHSSDKERHPDNQQPAGVGRAAEESALASAASVLDREGRRGAFRSLVSRTGASQGNGASNSPSDQESKPKGKDLRKESARRSSSPRKTDPAPSSSQGENQESSQGRIAGGGAGSGRMASVKNKWQQREATGENEADAEDRSPDPPDETHGSEQRGGVQPSLPDRTQSPSRELGITGPQSKRVGTGRGGPSPVKKSRGAASLLMGVPIPDFVRGRRSPGTSAITLEKTPPITFSSDASPSYSARTRTTDEATIDRYEVPWSEAAPVRSYLMRWHATDKPHPDQTAPTSSRGDSN